MASFHPEYAAKRWPGETRILGVRLVAPTIDHALLLWSVESPYVTGAAIQAEESIGHLVTALYILSRPCSEAAKGLPSKRGWRRKFWARQIRIRCGLVRRTIAHCDLQAFIAAAFEEPDMWEKEGGSGGACSAPYLQVLKVRLQRCLGCSREEALSYPIAEAIWDLACYAEDMGFADWVSADEKAAIQAIGE